jgi:hypothetical protein
MRRKAEREDKYGGSSVMAVRKGTRASKCFT